jgi:hypothetical protein
MIPQFSASLLQRGGRDPRQNGLLDRELVFDWLWVSGSWERAGPAAKRAREKAGVAQLYENYEALAAGPR